MSSAMRNRKGSRRRQAGVAAIEFVFVFPVLLLLFFGLVNFAHYISTSQRIAQAAVVAADIVSRTADDRVKAADFTDAFTAAELAITPLPIANVRIDIYDYFGSPASLRWKKSSPNGPDCAAPNPAVSPISNLLIATGQPGATDVIVVVACMAYAAPVPEFPGLREIFSNIVIRRSVSLRPRDRTQLDCDAC